MEWLVCGAEEKRLDTGAGLAVARKMQALEKDRNATPPCSKQTAEIKTFKLSNT